MNRIIMTKKMTDVINGCYAGDDDIMYRIVIKYLKKKDMTIEQLSDEELLFIKFGTEEDEVPVTDEILNTIKSLTLLNKDVIVIDPSFQFSGWIRIFHAVCDNGGYEELPCPEKVVEAFQFIRISNKGENNMGIIAENMGLEKMRVYTETEANIRYDNYVPCKDPKLEQFVGTTPSGKKEVFFMKYIEPHDCVKRISKDEYYLRIAEAVSMRGTCLRRRFGAVIVKDDRIVSTGYVGAPHGRANCCDTGICFRIKNNIPPGTQYEKCRSVHAEMNAIISASKEEMKDAVMYLVGMENDGTYTNADCCAMCKRTIINSGITHVICRQTNGTYIKRNVSDWVTDDDSLDINHEGY